MCWNVWWGKNYLRNTISSWKNVRAKGKVQKFYLDLKNRWNLLGKYTFTIIWYIWAYVSLKSLLSFYGRCSNSQHTKYQAYGFWRNINKINKTCLIWRMGSKWIINRFIKYGKTLKKSIWINSLKIRFWKILTDSYRWIRKYYFSKIASTRFGWFFVEIILTKIDILNSSSWYWV